MQFTEIGLHIKYHPPVPIKKPFSNTHALFFGLEVPLKFSFLIVKKHDDLLAICSHKLVKKSATSCKTICYGFLEYLGWESNPHSRKNWILNPARLPVPPPRQVVF